MFKVLVVTVLVVTSCEGRSDESNLLLNKVASNRQKRLLFFDEEGNLVKTYSRPYMNEISEMPTRLPFFGKFFNPFLSFLRPSTFSAMTYMVPVSDEVIQQVNRDPVFQNKITLLPVREPQIQFNPSCIGRRSQIASSKSCGSFLNCWDGWAFEQDCPAGLLFSLEGYCDYDENVNCNERWASDASQPSCSKEFEAFRNELNCNEFYVCVNRLPIRFKCPADLAYSQALGVCDYPYRVECNASLTIATDSPPNQAPAEPVLAPASDPSSGDTIPAETKPPTETKPQGSVPPVTNSPSATNLQAMIIPQAVIDPIAKHVSMTHSVYNSQSVSTTHVAMSRQDAIRQLRLSNFADVTSA